MQLLSCIFAAGLLCSASAADPRDETESCELASAELRVTVRRRGAELVSVREVASGHEYLWQNANGAWAGSAPVLFPIVGALRTGNVRQAGRETPLPQHGFARIRDFELLTRRPDAATLALTGTGGADYPWPYRLVVTYSVNGRSVSVRATVENPATGVLPFSLGFHPGINTTLGDSERDPASVLHVASAAPIARLWRQPESKWLSEQRTTWSEGRSSLPLTTAFATPPALVLACGAPVELTVEDRATNHRVTLRTDAPFLGLWRPAGAAAQFLCLEPWWGTTDPDRPYGDFLHKPHLQLLEPGGKFAASFTLSFN